MKENQVFKEQFSYVIIKKHGESKIIQESGSLQKKFLSKDNNLKTYKFTLGLQISKTRETILKGTRMIPRSQNKAEETKKLGEWKDEITGSLHHHQRVSNLGAHLSAHN
jgi:antitoxin component YwqK of YwqJK toxin-antitoxin module